MTNAASRQGITADSSNLVRFAVRIAIMALLATIALRIVFYPSYPCEFELSSRVPEMVKIINCEGMGFAQPDGLVMPMDRHRRYHFGRVNHYPKEIIIHWC